MLLSCSAQSEDKNAPSKNMNTASKASSVSVPAVRKPKNRIFFRKDMAASRAAYLG